MAYFYSDPAPKSDLDFSKLDLSRIDGTRKYLEHYSNLLTLKVVAKEGNILDRIAAEKEITICNRKLLYWERHPRFDSEKAIKQMATLKAQWGGRAD